jgi:hypothetical protein
MSLRKQELTKNCNKNVQLRTKNHQEPIFAGFSGALDKIRPRKAGGIASKRLIATTIGHGKLIRIFLASSPLAIRHQPLFPQKEETASGRGWQPS